MDKQIILVDSSYTSFYRFFATLQWYQRAYKDEYKNIKDQEKDTNKQYNWLNNTVFIKTYTKMYLESIVKLIKKKNFKNSIIIFCKDAPRETLWRKNILNSYKDGRTDLSLNNDFKPVFKYTYENIIPNIILENNNVFSIGLDMCEADDIIACITLYLKNYNPMQKIIIVSGDNDFLQLGRSNVYFINYKKKELIEISTKEAEMNLYNKIILGDKSDSISGIFSNKKEVINCPDKLKIFLKNNNKINDKYIINQSLIDFNFIPKEYYNKIINEYKKIMK